MYAVLQAAIEAALDKVCDILPKTIRSDVSWTVLRFSLNYLLLSTVCRLAI